MVVEDFMTANPVVVQVTESVGSVLTKLLEADVRHLPVVEGRALVGIVSDRDLRPAMDLIPEVGSSSRAQSLGRPISSLMSGDVISVYPETEIEEVIDLMLDHKIGAIPVTKADSLEVIGIISYMDVLRAARDNFS